MTSRRLSALSFVAAAMLSAAACVPRPRTTPEAAARGDLIVLLPDADTGRPGAVNVSNAHGNVDLTQARTGAAVARDRAPVLVTTVSDVSLRALTDLAFAAMPPAPQHFILNFEFNSDELTAPSRGLIVDLQLAVQRRQFPEVLIIGHTDTVGSAAGNFALGRRRADMIRSLLVGIGMDPSLIEVTSHGESDLLIPTADEVAEPRNRRVEITLR
jgi:outer membrane protein OmpA-like peptidoglycan-associated protein